MCNTHCVFATMDLLLGPMIFSIKKFIFKKNCLMCKHTVLNLYDCWPLSYCHESLIYNADRIFLKPTSCLVQKIKNN